jgi:hypothetical protein
VTTDQAWRAEAKPWFDALARLVSTGQSTCSGHIMRQTSTKIFPNLYSGRKATEAALIENALWGTLRSVFEGVDKGRELMLEQTLRDSLYAMISHPSWTTTAPGPGPWNDLAVAGFDASDPPFCNTVPANGLSKDVDRYQVWSSFAYAYELTQDPVFQKRALELSGTTDLQKFLEKFNFYNIENQAALMALVQGP